MYVRFVKRWLDVILSLLALIVLALPMLFIGLLVRLDSPGSVLFRQRRLGLHGAEFTMLKFRSMCENAESAGTGVYSEKGDYRVTRIGRFLRATSLDELPQLWNIFTGDMSFIGPRPPLTYHPWPWEEYSAEQRRMFDVRPGLTGWAQVNGRKTVEWHKRIALNVWYVDHVSFALDVKIFFLTIIRVFSNANNENSGMTVGAGVEETR